MNFSHLASPALPPVPTATRESSLTHPKSPLPPPSNLACAALHSLEKYFGSNGNFPSNDQRLLSPEGVPVAECDDNDEDGRGGGWETDDRDGSSKTCNVALSLVTARRHEAGEMASEKIVALSMPLRSSVIKREVAVEYTRIKVPCIPLISTCRTDLFG